MINKYKTKKNFYLYFIHFIVCIIIFFIFFSIIFIYYGPFENIRSYIVSTAMHTNKDKFFATWFLPKKKIDDILAKTNPIILNDKENIESIKVQINNNYKADDSNKLNADSNVNTDSGSNNFDQTTKNQISQNQISQNNNDPKTNSISTNPIEIIDISGKNYKGKLMIVKDPSKVTIGLAPKLGEVGATLSKIVQAYGAIGGINAGGFLDDNFLGTGSKPEGIVIENGKIKFIQNELNTFRIIGFNQDNILIVSNSMTLNEIKQSNLRCAISFGPALILNGKPLVVNGGATIAPRSAIGQRKDGAVILLAIDGRQTDSPGANFMDLQEILLKYGAYNAANLDGGSSTTMNFQGKTINKPCDITGERSIASAFIIMP